MNRRKFIRNASLATAGSVIAGSLPAWASVATGTDRHVVLAVVAGISREDFVQLFPKTLSDALGNAGRLITDMRYNGQAAGHRLALESLLQGHYLSEKQSGKILLQQTALFTAVSLRNQGYFISSDRDFLKTGSHDLPSNAFHFCIGLEDSKMDTPTRGTRPHVAVKNADPTDTKLTQTYEDGIAKSQSKYTQGALWDEDSRLAEAACEVIRQNQPQVLLTHFMGADTAHFDATLAQKNREKIAIGLQHIWETVCEQPGMQNTLFLVVADFGRNTAPNAFKNAEGLLGTDHSITDENTKNIACLLASPKGLPKKIATSGESIDILPTLLHFLGTKTSMELPGKSLL